MDGSRVLWFWLYYHWKTRELRIYRLEDWSHLKRDLGILEEDDAPGGGRLQQEEQIYRCCIVLPSYVYGAANVINHKDLAMPGHQTLMAEFNALADICKPFPGPEQSMVEYLAQMIGGMVYDFLPPYQFLPHGSGVGSGILREADGSYVEFGEPKHRYRITVEDCGEVDR